MRDDKWLFSKLDEIWDTYFPDVPQDNDVRIVWGRRARTRLGSIRQIPSCKYQIPNTKYLPRGEAGQIPNTKYQIISQNTKYKIQDTTGRHLTTLITINSLFKDAKIPEFVVVATIGHELAHYAHGFHSPLEQRFATPHAGGIVHSELRERGLGALEKRQKKWLKDNWREFLSENMPQKTTRRKRRIVIKWF